MVRGITKQIPVLLQGHRGLGLPHSARLFLRCCSSGWWQHGDGKGSSNERLFNLEQVSCITSMSNPKRRAQVTANPQPIPHIPNPHRSTPSSLAATPKHITRITRPRTRSRAHSRTQVASYYGLGEGDRNAHDIDSNNFDAELYARARAPEMRLR